MLGLWSKTDPRAGVVPRKRRKTDFATLESFAEDLRVPSLTREPPSLQGHAYRFMIVLPVLSQTGEEVFSESHLIRLCDLLNRRFGGVLASSSIAHPTWYGSYLPRANDAPVGGYHFVMVVFARRTVGAD